MRRAVPLVGNNGSAVLSQHKPRILVADDHLTEREYLKTLLGYAGYEVVEAGDGEEALDLLRSQRPDLVITDILMPKLDGLELVRRMRSRPEFATTRVIVWSASFRQQEAQALASALEVARFLKKPVEPETLLATVEEILRAPPPVPVPAAALARLEEAHQRLLSDKLFKRTLELEEEIGARQQIEVVLSESRQRFAGLVQTTMDAIVAIDAEQRIVLFNAAAEAMFRRPAAEAIGSPLDLLLPERYRAAHRQHVRRFAAAGTTSRAMGQLGAPLWGLRADGEEFPVEASISKVHVGGQWQFTAILRDVTERRQAEEALRQQAMLLDLAPDPIMVWSAGRGILFWNDACQEFYGYSQPEALGRFPHELLRTVFPLSLDACLSELAATRQWSGELRHTTRDGRELVLSSRMLQLEIDGKTVTLQANRCITERMHLEDALRQLNRDLERRVAERTAELTRANEALLKRNEELRQFAFIASHDLQTPLRAVVGYAQLLQQDYHGRLDAPADDLIRNVVDNAKRLHRLIHELLVYVRVDAPAPPFVPVDFRQVFSDVVGALAAFIHEAGAGVDCGELPIVMGDRSQLTQLLQNLVDNAIKYRGGEPPRVRVSAERQGAEWVFSVRDNGIGVPRGQHERIFGIFRRLHTQQAYPGTGIGLAICRRVVERHGGRIWVESEPGQGSVFRFTLPAGRAGEGLGAASGLKR